MMSPFRTRIGSLCPESSLPSASRKSRRSTRCRAATKTFALFAAAICSIFTAAAAKKWAEHCESSTPTDKVQVVPAFGASANTSGGILTADGFTRLQNEFLGCLADAGPVDAAFFSLHGAMQAENEDDPEGRLLSEARRILGEKIPFVVSLDLHGILTDRMLEHSDAVVPYHTYPHVDFVETGRARPDCC